MLGSSLSDKIIDKLIQMGSIKEGEKELYAYGLEQGLFILLNLVTTVIIGIIAGMLWQSILFMLVYLPLRSFAGGYHARTQQLCYLLSAILISVVLLMIRFVPWTDFISISLMLLSGIIIFIFAPVEDMNKPLDEIEIVRYKKITRMILVSEILIALFMLILGLNNILPSIAVSLFALSIMLILGARKVPLLPDER